MRPQSRDFALCVLIALSIAVPRAAIAEDAPAPAPAPLPAAPATPDEKALLELLRDKRTRATLSELLRLLDKAELATPGGPAATAPPSDVPAAPEEPLDFQVPGGARTPSIPYAFGGRPGPYVPPAPSSPLQRAFGTSSTTVTLPVAGPLALASPGAPPSDPTSFGTLPAEADLAEADAFRAIAARGPDDRLRAYLTLGSGGALEKAREDALIDLRASAPALRQTVRARFLETARRETALEMGFHESLPALDARWAVEDLAEVAERADVMARASYGAKPDAAAAATARQVRKRQLLEETFRAVPEVAASPDPAARGKVAQRIAASYEQLNAVYDPAVVARARADVATARRLQRESLATARAAYERRVEERIDEQVRVATETQYVANVDASFRRHYRRELWDAHAHNPLDVQEVAAYGDRPGPLLSMGFGAFGGPELGSSLAVGSDADRKYRTEWGAVVFASTKMSVVGSTASSDDLEKLQEGREHGLRKGFNFDAISVDNDLAFGGLVGRLRAEYYQNPSGDDDELELIDAYAQKEWASSADEGARALLVRLGVADVLMADSYGENEWGSWAWGERPFVYGRMFNGNLIAPGLTLAGMLPLTRSGATQLLIRGGAYSADSEQMKSFLQGTVGDFPLDPHRDFTFADLAYAGHLGLRHRACLGGLPLLLNGSTYALWGPNATGDDGETLVYGAHARAILLFDSAGLERTPLKEPSDGLLVEGEWLRRDYHVDRIGAAGPRNLEDWGWWVTAMYAHRWGSCGAFPNGSIGFGLRYDTATGSGDSFSQSRHDDPDRADRSRASAVVCFDPGDVRSLLRHFKLSLQYNFDDAEAIADEAHTIYLGIQVK